MSAKKLFLVMVAITLVFAAGGRAPALGQEQQLPEGIALEVIASGAYEAAPEGPGLIEILRETFAPDAELSYPDGDPSFGIFTVESGELTLTVTHDFTIRRAGGDGTPTAEGAEDAITAGTTVVLAVGDSAVLPPGSGATFRNAGDVPVIIVGAHLIPLAAFAE